MVPMSCFACAYSIGDLITELPLIDQLRESLPEATIIGLGAEPAVEILKDSDRLDQVVSIQHWGIQRREDCANEQIRRHGFPTGSSRAGST